MQLEHLASLDLALLQESNPSGLTFRSSAFYHMALARSKVLTEPPPVYFDVGVGRYLASAVLRDKIFLL